MSEAHIKPQNIFDYFINTNSFSIDDLSMYKVFLLPLQPRSIRNFENIDVVRVTKS